MKKIAFLLLLVIAAACSGDDDKGSTGVSGNNKYSYLGKEYALSEAEYYIVGDDVYFYLTDFGNGNYESTVQLIYAWTMLDDIVGSYTAHPDRDIQTYDPETNFWTGGINYKGSDGADSVQGGNIKIELSDNNTQIDITFTVTTDTGDKATGHYSGPISERE